MKRSRTSSAATLMAAVSVAVGSLTVGVGPATAQAPEGWELLGSVDSPGCWTMCPLSYVADETRVENVRIRRDTPTDIERGSLVAFPVKFFIGPSDPARSVTKVVDHPPAGFVFIGVQAKRIGFQTGESFETIVDVDESTGAVTVEAPPGGWPIPKQVTTDQVEVTFTYHVPITTRLGSVSSHATAEVSGIDPSRVRALSGVTDVVELEANDLAPASVGRVFGS